MKAPGGTIGAKRLTIKTLFFMLFWDIFQPTFSTQNLGVGWMKYACSIK